MDALARLLAERACERLVTEYCHLVDHGEAARIAELFTEDGVWSSPENTMTGREAIARGFARRQANTARMSRHVCGNVLIDVTGADQATGVCYLTLYRHDGVPERATSPSDVPAIVGEYRDTFARNADGWRFKRREIVVSFVKA
jgi:uncharacterized protein (TIGR02246 family)